MRRWGERVIGLGLVLWGLHGPGGAAPAAAKPAPEWTGTVSRVVDGDTVWVTPADGGEPQVVRLDGIDAPERCQPWGAEATQALSELTLGQRVGVRGRARDDHGRLIGKLVKDGGVDVGDRLVRDGHAWSARYRHDRGPYVAEERMARALSRGLHAGGAAIPPRDFRRRHGPCERPAEAAVPAAPPAAVTAAPAAPRCDGRLYCTQMTSCAEATWFLRNCPGVKLDGNGDGVPCERQWCRR